MFTEEDKKLIAELGFENDSESQQQAQLAGFHEALQIRTGLALEDQMNDSQLAEFEKIHDAGDDAATETWVRQAVSNYDGIVAAEKANLIQDIKDTAARMRKAIDDSK